MFLADILASQPQLHPYVPRLWRAYAISSQARISAYDCLYVALAEREACELLRADDRLVRTLQPTFPFITALASLPKSGHLVAALDNLCHLEDKGKLMIVRFQAGGSPRARNRASLPSRPTRGHVLFHFLETDYADRCLQHLSRQVLQAPLGRDLERNGHAGLEELNRPP